MSIRTYKEREGAREREQKGESERESGMGETQLEKEERMAKGCRGGRKGGVVREVN